MIGQQIDFKFSLEIYVLGSPEQKEGYSQTFNASAQTTKSQPYFAQIHTKHAITKIVCTINNFKRFENQPLLGQINAQK